MVEKLSYWASLLLGSIAVVLLVVNVSVANANRTLQADVAQRQNIINSGQTLSQINQGLVQAMAEAALKNNNTQLRDLLSTQGVTLKSEPVKTGDAASPASASAAKPADKK